MNDTTKAFLRDAVLEALAVCADSSALELLALLNGSQVSSVAPSPVAVLPAAREVTDGPARDYHYWTRFIRENFIPFMTGNGRLRFTSHELLTWLENCNALRLTAGDIEPHATGRETWRNTVSAALAHLKRQGAINAPAFSKDYLICPPSFPVRSRQQAIEGLSTYATGAQQ